MFRNHTLPLGTRIKFWYNTDKHLWSGSQQIFTSCNSKDFNKIVIERKVKENQKSYQQILVPLYQK